MYVLFQEFISNTANTSENPYFCQIDTYTGIERGSSMIYTEFYEGHTEVVLQKDDFRNFPYK
jgi:hypothetical protein